MDIAKTLRRIGEAMQVRQVFGEPVERDGMLVIPVASVIGVGAGGGGSGTGDRQPAVDGPRSGAGGEVDAGGFCSRTRPLGVYVICDGKASWQPVVDINRMVLTSQVIVGAQVVAVVGMLTVRSILRRRR